MPAGAALLQPLTPLLVVRRTGASSRLQAGLGRQEGREGVGCG